MSVGAIDFVQLPALKPTTASTDCQLAHNALYFETQSSHSNRISVSTPVHAEPDYTTKSALPGVPSLLDLLGGHNPRISNRIVCELGRCHAVGGCRYFVVSHAWVCSRSWPDATAALWAASRSPLAILGHLSMRSNDGGGNDLECLHHVLFLSLGSCRPRC